jgi:hypothetical protein
MKFKLSWGNGIEIENLSRENGFRGEHSTVRQRTLSVAQAYGFNRFSVINLWYYSGLEKLAQILLYFRIEPEKLNWR